MIKNIIFDLSEVLIDGVYGAMKEINREHGIPIDELKKWWDNIHFKGILEGKSSEGDYIKEIKKGFDMFSEEEIAARIRRSFDVHYPDMIELLYVLKEQNYNLILLSDHGKEWIEYIKEKHEFINVFDKLCFSYDYGKTKKDKSLFIDVVNDLKINPNETLFIDDSHVNVENAKDVGIYGIVYKTYAELVEELEDIIDIKLEEKIS